MSRYVVAGGQRRPNASGHVKPKALASGEMRYQARLGTRYLGTFDTRAQAQLAIEAAQRAEQVEP